MILFHHARGLPMFAASRHPETGEPIMIYAGEQGYWPLAPDIDPEKFNRDIGATPAQLRAMEIGSMFGWEVPGSFVKTEFNREDDT